MKNFYEAPVVEIDSMNDEDAIMASLAIKNNGTLPELEWSVI